MWFLNIKACQHIMLHQIHKIINFEIASYDPYNDPVHKEHQTFLGDSL